MNWPRHAYPCLLGVQIIRHLSQTLLVTIAGNKSVVDLNLLTKEKQRDIRRAVEECCCTEEVICGLSQICLECGKLLESSATCTMMDESKCLVCRDSQMQGVSTNHYTAGSA